jgi:hypothetical protein
MLPYAGAIPVRGGQPLVVLFLQKELLSASDVFFGINIRQTEDLGRHWSPLLEDPGLGRRKNPDGTTVGITAVVLKWNPGLRKLLGVGETSFYHGDLLDREGAQRPAYTVYDAKSRQWSPWQTLAVPDEAEFHTVNEGCCQRVDLPGGTILLPVYVKAAGITAYSTTVLRCSFDGRLLTYGGHGNLLTLPFDPDRLDKKLSFNKRQFIARQSGLFEPSLTLFQGRYYLTMRNFNDDYVAIGKDGLHFGGPSRWSFDDGRPLDSENTQSHWVTHGDGLFLIYTRRGANNDHVFRHRAPLFMAQVDPARLCILRSTERILVPDRGAGLGGSVGVTEVSDRETWVTTSEVMQTSQPNWRDFSSMQKYGADGRVYAARIFWDRPDHPAATSIP